MEDRSNESAVCGKPSVTHQAHHTQHQLCLTRPRYRQGRKLTSVKVYTIHDESCYLLILGVPTLDLDKELKKLCKQFGRIRAFHRLPDYPTEKFTEVFLCKYSCIQEARKGKKNLDGRGFFGGVFHVCYAPELENPCETRDKIRERYHAHARLQARENCRDSSSSTSYHTSDKLATSLKSAEERYPLSLESSSSNAMDVDGKPTNSTDPIGCSSNGGPPYPVHNSKFDTIKGPRLGDSASYPSSSASFEPHAGSNNLVNKYIPSVIKRKSTQLKNTVKPENPVSMKVYKKPKISKKEVSSVTFIGPKNREDKSLKTWNEAFTNTHNYDKTIEEKKDILMKKKTDILAKFQSSLHNSLLKPPDSKSIRNMESNRVKSK